MANLNRAPATERTVKDSQPQLDRRKVVGLSWIVASLSSAAVGVRPVA